MAAALFNRYADPQKAAGISRPDRARLARTPGGAGGPQGIDIDVSGAVPRFLSDELASKANVLVTMGCGETSRWCPASNASIGRWRTRRDGRSHASARLGTKYAESVRAFLAKR